MLSNKFDVPVQWQFSIFTLKNSEFCFILSFGQKWLTFENKALSCFIILHGIPQKDKYVKKM